MTSYSRLPTQLPSNELHAVFMLMLKAVYQYIQTTYVEGPYLYFHFDSTIIIYMY